MTPADVTRINALRAQCRDVMTVVARRQQRHALGCQAAAAVFASLLTRGAGLAAPGATTAVAHALVTAYLDSTLGTGAPRRAGHDTAIEAAGEELRRALERLGFFGHMGGRLALAPVHQRALAGVVIGRYHIELAAHDRGAL